MQSRFKVCNASVRSACDCFESHLADYRKDPSAAKKPLSETEAKAKIEDLRKQIEAGADAARFVVSEAWPIKYDPTDLNAKGNEVLIELLELVNEGIERVK